MEWVFRYGVGIERDEENPGYKHIILQPTIGGSFSYMKGRYDSIYGMIESGWTVGEGGAFTYNASVPANTTATLYLPQPAYGSVILESRNPAESAEGVTDMGIQDGKAVFELSSGDYSFSLSIDPNDAVLRNVRIDAPQGVDAKAVIKGQEYALPMNEMIFGGAGEVRIVSNDPDYTFAYWGDGVFDANPERVLPSGESVSCAAYFKYVGGESAADEATLTLDGEEGAAVCINGERYDLPYTGTFKKGAELVIDPVAPSGKTFSHWEGGILLSNPAAVQLNGDVNATAVFEEIQFEDNLALGKKSSTNSNITVTGANNWDIKNLTDGVYVGQGYSSTLTQSEDASANPVWAEIDLEKNTVFDRVVLYPRTDAESYQTGNHAFPQNFAISVKKDGESEYTVVKTITGHADSADPVALDFDVVEARYVRLTVTKFHPVAKRVQLAEMAVVHTQQSAPYVVAQHRAAGQ